MRAGTWGWALAGVVGLMACGRGRAPPPPPPCCVPPSDDDAGWPGSGSLDAGSVDGGLNADGGTPADAGSADAGLAPDGGAGGDAGTSAWPTEVLNYSAAYGLGTPQSVGLDDADNLWVLDGARIGVLRPGSTRAIWASGIGQAGLGYSSSVICGGRPGEAVVGYLAADPVNPRHDPPLRRSDPSEGDADSVVLTPEGTLALEEHINIFNSNDHHYNEVASIFTCAKVMRGPNRGDLFLGSNHAVTRVRVHDCDQAADPEQRAYKTCYADHRHAVWDVNGSLRIGYNYAVSLTQDGDVFLGNEWKLALLTPTRDPQLTEWYDFDATPWRVDTYVAPLNSLEEMDFWRATAQTTDGTYYLGSARYGLWEMHVAWRPPPSIKGDPTFAPVAGPSSAITSLAATDDGALYIGTAGSGLWRMGPATEGKTLAPVAEVPGRTVRQLVYDPTQAPSMLLVVTDAGVFALRGR